MFPKYKIRSCSQKLSALKKNHKYSRKTTRSLDREMKPKSLKVVVPEEDSPPSFINKKKSKRKNNKTKKPGPSEQLSNSNPEEIKIDFGFNVEPSRIEEKKKVKDGPWLQGKKGGRQTVARSRFRKSGIVATATVHTYGDEAENSEDGDEKTEGTNSKKKKKKRKFLTIHRKVRKVINSVTATSSDKTTLSSQVSSSKQR